MPKKKKETKSETHTLHDMHVYILRRQKDFLRSFFFLFFFLQVFDRKSEENSRESKKQKGDERKSEE